METLIFLDTGVIGKLIHPAPTEKLESIQCNEWLERLLENKLYAGFSEIADYENRREHIRRIQNPKSSLNEKQKAAQAIQRLDELKNTDRIGYFPVTGAEGDVMLKAAEIWAFARNNGYNVFDADVIIAAQAVVIKQVGIDVIIATTDPGDFNRMLKPYHIPARRWRDIII